MKLSGVVINGFLHIAEANRSLNGNATVLWFCYSGAARLQLGEN